MDGTFVMLTTTAPGVDNVCRSIALRDHLLFAHAQTQTDVGRMPSNRLKLRLHGFPTYYLSGFVVHLSGREGVVKETSIKKMEHSLAWAESWVCLH